MRAFGYDVVREHDARGEPIHGGRKINKAETAVVRRIFTEFAAGKSPRRIAVGLNRDGVSGPRGGEWDASTINGNATRGTGILNNELYVGRLASLPPRRGRLVRYVAHVISMNRVLSGEARDGRRQTCPLQGQEHREDVVALARPKPTRPDEQCNGLGRHLDEKTHRFV